MKIASHSLGGFLRTLRDDGSIPPRMVQAKGEGGQKVMKRVMFLMFLLLFSGCAERLSDEERLHHQIAAMQQNLEEKRLDRFMEVVAEDFVGNQRLDRRQLWQMLAGQMLLHDGIVVRTGPMTLVQKSDTAVVRFQAVSIGTGAHRWMPESARFSELETHWRKVADDRWQVYRATW